MRKDSLITEPEILGFSGRLLLELRYSLVSQPGKLRLMAWANRANMGSYASALAQPITTPLGSPTRTLVSA